MSEVAVLPVSIATPEVAAIPEIRSKTRWLTLDLLRFVAVVLMIQGHVFYEVIADSVKQQDWYRWHSYVHGFTAPIFLFSSGVAFGITTLGKWEEHTKLGKPVYKRIERYAILMGLGYLLQMGGVGIRRLASMAPERLEAVTLVNALQIIALVLAVAELLVIALRTQKRFLMAIGLLLTGVVFVAPWTHDLTLTSWPIPLRAWVTFESRSLFPIFPWAGFLLAGILFAAFIRIRRKQAPAGFMQLTVPFFAIAAALMLVGKLATLPSWIPEHTYWQASPLFFLFRLGIVAAVLGVLSAVDVGLARKPSWGRSSPVQLLQTLGAETLVIYVAHLLIIYGFLGIHGIRYYYRHEMTLLPAIVTVVAVFSSMVVFAWVWHDIKTRKTRAFDTTRYFATAAFVALFLVG